MERGRASNCPVTLHSTSAKQLDSAVLNLSHALLAAPSLTGRQMSNKPDSPSAALGDVLSLALDRAIGSSLDSLLDLRKSVKGYATHQKARRVPLDEVMRAISTVLMEVEDERSANSDGNGHRDPELARQLRAWCSEDYQNGADSAQPAKRQPGD